MNLPRPRHRPTMEETLQQLKEDLQGSRRENSELAQRLEGMTLLLNELLERQGNYQRETERRLHLLEVYAQSLETQNQEILRHGDNVHQETERLRLALGRIEARQTRDSPLSESEFSVFSQGGEDGLLAGLLHQLPEANQRFVEFGVEDYQEANTRFLLLSQGWSGLILDGDPKNLRKIHASHAYWQTDLTAVTAFITRENINDLLTEQGFTGEIGLLSIDLDGNDYWVWEAIEKVTPAVVSIEYNWRFGPERAVTIPYDPAFDRRTAHPSWLYFGASLAALERLGAQKGYTLVAVSRSGVNAFFVRESLRPERLAAQSAQTLWRPGSFSETRTTEGSLMKLSVQDQLQLVENLPQVRV